jgi:hypothetical protein
MRAVSCATLLALVAMSSGALADEKENCAAAYTDGQSLRDAHKLVEARAKLRACSQPACASFMQRDCAQWLEQVEQGLPSVVLIAHTASGAAVVDATVVIDDAPTPVATRLDGRAIDVDPGEHRFTFTTPGGDRVVVTSVVVEAEHAQKVVGTIGAMPGVTGGAGGDEAHAAATSSPLRTFGFVVGGLGVASLVTGAVFGIVAMASKGSSCDATGQCSPAGTVSKLTTEANVSTATLVAGGVLAAAGLTMVILGSPQRSKSASAWIVPSPGGVTLQGAF